MSSGLKKHRVCTVCSPLHNLGRLTTRVLEFLMPFLPSMLASNRIRVYAPVRDNAFHCSLSGFHLPKHRYFGLFYVAREVTHSIGLTV
jgi:hypothetical protein